MSADPSVPIIDGLAAALGRGWTVTDGEHELDAITRPTVVVWTNTVTNARWDYPATVYLWVLAPERRTRPGRLFDALMEVTDALKALDLVTTWSVAERGLLGERFIGYYLEISATVTKGVP